MSVSSRKGGFTLVELLVVIAIIGTLVGLLLPAVQSARESARKSQCSNNVKQQALGAANYYSTNLHWPTSGEGYDFVAGKDCLNVESFQQQILPFIEQAGIAAKWQTKKPYWDTSVGADGVSSNMLLAATKIAAFLCPSNQIGKDSFGGTNAAAVAAGKSFKYYGTTDYMPVAYTDIDPSNDRRWKASGTTKNGWRDGLLTYDQSGKDSLDGTSNTALFFEDSGRSSINAGKRLTDGTNCDFAYVDAAGGVSVLSGTGGSWTAMSTTFPSGMVATSGGSAAGTANAVPNRWADGDNASGLSGPPNEEGTSASVSGYRTQTIINNHAKLMPSGKSKYGGAPADETTAAAGVCSWQLNNCGPNDEPFSLHAGNGCFAGFADGSVHWINAQASPQVLRQLVDPNDGEQPLNFQ